MDYGVKATEYTKRVYYKVKYYQIRMLKYQKFDTSEEEAYPFFQNFEEEGMKDMFMNYYIDKARSKGITIPQALTKVYYNSEGVEKQCYYMNESSSVSGDVLIDQVRKMLDESSSINNIIIISPGKLGSDTKSTLIDFPALVFTCFQYSELLNDPFDNDLVPRHTLLSFKQTKNFYRANPNIEESNLPCIYENDPVAKRLNGKPGQIMFIERYICVKGSFVSYSSTIRRVIEGEIPKKTR
uniref:DNA-directed RNA polymerase subunit 5 n=1 Tax=Pithovirus LCPAC403 TaxID=2506596 RepID=A0A481ZB18_9VIRU|nr:MAG: DNA-directed RNA polymerase subunit 5 [Pithovirus LCPAC403]